ncbi:MAG: hypothetical protein EOO09_00175 [Chitinophagaceae bacterium]|nr:MAG: hypothetical protein EOO09_00175 [Chitinophagaceae bacterium]
MKPVKLLLLSLLLLTVVVTGAQPFSLDERVVPVELKMEEYTVPGKDKPDGRLAKFVTTQETDTAYYYVKGLSMYSPTYFSINGIDDDVSLHVNLCQENWRQSLRSGDVSGTKIWNSKFKTEDGFGIMVVAKNKPARYVLLTWTGKELDVPMPSVFRQAGESGSADGLAAWSKANLLTVGIIVLALAVIIFLVIRLNKKKKS